MNSDGGVERIDLEKVDWRGSREFFESLSDELRSLDDKDESYDFTWVGKRKAVIEAGAPINKTLRPDVDASKNWSDTENLFIEGDNLDALKLLQESYLGKVKMIYIDPPYNTGKDFVYHDNFKATTEQYDEDTEYHDENGNIQFKKNEKSNGRYHSDWLSMMYPRLKLARNLLSDDGVIFISIDDNEQANLKKLCDEVFGEDNFVAQFIWKSKLGKVGTTSTVSTTQEYILCYARHSESTTFKMIERENEGRRENLRQWGQADRREDRPSMYYPITVSGIEVYPKRPDGSDGRWRVSRQRAEELLSEGMLELVSKGTEYSIYRIFPAGVSVTAFETILDKVGTTASGTKTLGELELQQYFDYPKPAELVNFFAQLITKDDDLIVDFFSGSATTAHAVMQLNAQDGGNRKWIMVQLPEVTDEKSEAYKAGYRTIPEISRERIRRAGDKIAAEHPEAKVDYGFRALRIDDTNHKDVYRPAADVQQSMLDDLVDNIKDDRSDLDLLYGVLTQSALELNRPTVTDEIDGATVYKYDYFSEVSGLVACFAPTISEATIKQIAQLRPLTAVFCESSFPDSQAKVNLAEHFRILSPDTKVKVI